MTDKIISLWIGLLMCCYLNSSSANAGNVKLPPSGKEFSREEFMLMNLNRGNDSTGAHLSESLKDSRTMVQRLEKSLRQLEEVDKAYARSKGKPDDRFLAPASQRLERALQKAQELASELESCREELKDNIHQTLLLNQ